MRMRTFAAVFVFLFSAQVCAEAPKFLRVLRDDNGKPVSLDTAVVRYEKGEGEDKITLDGIGAVHIGDKAYYASLNRKFREYDAMLYELVAPRGTRIPRGGRKSSGLDLQTFVGIFLQLDSQLTGVNYMAANFVHADLSTDEMKAKMRARGDSAVTIFLDTLGHMIRTYNLRELEKQTAPRRAAAVPELSISDLLMNPTKLKQFLAESFAGDLTGTILGSSVTKLLIDDRNEAALKVMDEQIALGRRKLALFYGAAHFPDFHKRLVARGFKPVHHSWSRAWDMSRPSAPNVSKLLELFMKATSNL